MVNFVKPSIEVTFHIPDDCQKPEVFLERVGRTCYKSEDRITADSADRFIGMLNKRGHSAMLEHCVASAKLICDRGVTHELVRHRVASYAQESTRYCDYSGDKGGGHINVIEPLNLSPDQYSVWLDAVIAAESAYMTLRGLGAAPQVARHVLPISVKTEIWITANLREWQHIFEMRCSKAAHPHIRMLMLEALKIFSLRVPAMFEGLWQKHGLGQ